MVKRGLFRRISLAAAAVCSALIGSPSGESQTVGESRRPTFEVVSVKPTPRDMMAYFIHGGPGSNDPGRIQYHSVDWGFLLWKAFGVEKDQLQPPGWMKTGEYLYDIEAVFPTSTTEQEFRLMFLNMLVDRFHLVYHRGRKSFPGYELTVASSGPKIHRSETPMRGPDTAATLKKRWEAEGFPAVPPGQALAMIHPPVSTAGMIRGTFHESISEFLVHLPIFIKESNRETRYDYPHYRIVDRTGLEGVYDFTLEFFGGPRLDVGGGPSIFEALERQLGLKLKRTTDVEAEVIVVDSAEKLPTQN